MRDLAIHTRSMNGAMKFGIQSAYVYGFDILIQKIAIFLLSESRDTFFGGIVGSEVLGVGKYNFSDTGSSEFKIQLISDLNNLTKMIKASDIENNIPAEDRLKSIDLIDLIYDKMNAHVYVSLRVNTYSNNRDIKLPVGKIYNGKIK